MCVLPSGNQLVYLTTSEEATELWVNPRQEVCDPFWDPFPRRVGT